MRDDIYRTAYDEATAELESIVGEFEALRARKERVEKVVAALKPFLQMEANNDESDQDDGFGIRDSIRQSSSPVPFPSQPDQPPMTIQYEEEPVPAPALQATEVSSDPFQRRIDSVLWGWNHKREGMLPAV